MEDNSNSPRREDCGDGEEEDRDQGTDDKGFTSSLICVEGSSGINPPSSSRQMRNLAEKQRRNKLNTCITELSQLVPLISNSSKKVEKTSVLRLSAAYLRLSRLLLRLKEQREQLPEYVNQVNLADLLLDDSDIYLMVTSAGKIVFVSHSVENILGHPQIDLMGQSIYNITCPEDHNELANNLKFQDDTSSSSIIASDDSMKNYQPHSGCKTQRRSFYMRLVKKAASRGEQPELELVHVVGALMMQNQETKNPLLGGNDIILNAVVRPYNERRVTEVSLLEATREEYITRHQIDGRIIYVDHRISIVSGFMPQEVSGQLAFTYMHKDDVRWVMIALRQMYFKGQSFGSSCYRLLSKNGEFVYMKTHGYLELNPNEDSIQSFICVNTLISAEEGKKEIIKMRERFTPLIRSQSDTSIAAITNNQFMEADSTTSLEDASTEDPVALDKAVEQMIINIPAPAIDNVKETAQNPGPLPDSQFIKVALLSKSMPPIKSDSKAPRIDKRTSISPKPNIPLPQDRPSVLRVAPPIARQPVVVYNEQINEKSVDKDREYYERRGGILVVPKRHNDLQLMTDQSPKKAKFILDLQADSPACSQYSNQMDGSQSDNQLSADDYGSLDDFSSFQNTPIPFSSSDDLDPLTDASIIGIDHFSKTLDGNDTSVNHLFLTPESYNSYDTGIYTEGSPTDISQDPILHVLKHEGSVESDLLEQKQITLKTKMDQQQGQLKEIQTELNSLSSNDDTQILVSDLSNIKAAHEQQQKILRTLQGVHQNIDV